jgi:hypothetical protein
MHLFTMRSQCFKSVIQSGRSLFLSKIKNTSLKWPVGVSPLQLVNLHRNQRYFVIKLHTWFCLIFLEDKHKILLHITIFYEYQQFFQHCICFSIQPQLQLVNLHKNQRYFVVKLHTWFCLSYFLKTNIKFYCIYQYFMSINSFFNTLSVSRYSRPITVTRDPD